MILSVKGKLKGAMTYWFEEWNETYKVGPIWHIGDFDTARTAGIYAEDSMNPVRRAASEILHVGVVETRAPLACG